ncbi:MAG: hypothetical protein FJ386_03520 [Verrucomicrobia bacterium]|nr:hypothetical protein [Verrucomicrobiota bacterium]
MPIRINLLAEQQAEEKARRQNPVKRAVLVVLFFAMLLALWGSSVFLKNSAAATELANTEASLHKMEKDAGATRTNLSDIRKIDQKMDALYALATNRFLWAPQLDVMQRAISPNIQLSRVRTEQRYVATVAEKSSDPKKPGKKASVTERITVIIEGRDSGRPEEQYYDKFKEKLLADTYFRSVMTNEAGVGFKQFSPVIVENNMSYFKFQLDCVFPERVRN